MLAFCATVTPIPADVTTETSNFPILIVEDDQPTQYLLRAILRRSPYTSEVATNGEEAINLLREKEYAAVILDMMMPEASGHEVIEFLTTAAKRVPVIICSAAGPTALTGFDPTVVKAVIRKPFDVDQLLGTVTAVARSAG